MFVVKSIILLIILIIFKALFNIDYESIFNSLFVYNTPLDFLKTSSFQHDEYVSEYLHTTINSNSVIKGEEFKKNEFELKVDFASLDSGSKIISYAPAIITVQNIQMPDVNLYMLVPCKDESWFIISFVDKIYLEHIAVTFLEHYASTFKHIRISASDTYPSNSWIVLAEVETLVTRSDEIFNISESCKNLEPSGCWARYLKVEMLSHHTIEHNYYCSLTNFRVYGLTAVEVLEREISEEKEFSLKTLDDIPEYVYDPYYDLPYKLKKYALFIKSRAFHKPSKSYISLNELQINRTFYVSKLEEIYNINNSASEFLKDKIECIKNEDLTLERIKSSKFISNDMWICYGQNNNLIYDGIYNVTLKMKESVVELENYQVLIFSWNEVCTLHLLPLVEINVGELLNELITLNLFEFDPIMQVASKNNCIELTYKILSNNKKEFLRRNSINIINKLLIPSTKYVQHSFIKINDRPKMSIDELSHNLKGTSNSNNRTDVELTTVPQRPQIYQTNTNIKVHKDKTQPSKHVLLNISERMKITENEYKSLKLDVDSLTELYRESYSKIQRLINENQYLSKYLYEIKENKNNARLNEDYSSFINLSQDNIWVQIITELMIKIKTYFDIIALGIAFLSLYYSFHLKSVVKKYQGELDKYKKKIPPDL